MLNSLADLIQQAEYHPKVFTNNTIISLLDLTRLNDNDTDNNIKSLCQQADSAAVPVASVCIYPEFITLVKDALKTTSIRIATVINFPDANQTVDTTCRDITAAIANGVDELDIVTPYHDYLSGDANKPLEFLAQCRKACGDKTMKVILETGALQEPHLIIRASEDAIAAGANFLKTSTGKINAGASLNAAANMLSVIHDTNANIGVKVSGGIKTKYQACQYLSLAQSIMGPSWIDSKHFRLGASSLLDELMPL